MVEYNIGGNMQRMGISGWRHWPKKPLNNMDTHGAEEEVPSDSEC